MPFSSQVYDLYLWSWARWKWPTTPLTMKKWGDINPYIRYPGRVQNGRHSGACPLMRKKEVIQCLCVWDPIMPKGNGKKKNYNESPLVLMNVNMEAFTKAHRKPIPSSWNIMENTQYKEYHLCSSVYYRVVKYKESPGKQRWKDSQVQNTGIAHPCLVVSLSAHSLCSELSKEQTWSH